MNYDAFVNGNKANVILDYTNIDDIIAQFEAKLTAWVGDDLGAVKVYSLGAKCIAWLDYERAVGYIP